MGTLTCAICKKSCDPRPANPYAPFCGVRCRQVDLGKWLDGAYRVPVEDSNSALDEDGEGEGGGASRGEDDA